MWSRFKNTEATYLPVRPGPWLVGSLSGSSDHVASATVVIESGMVGRPGGHVQRRGEDSTSQGNIRNGVRSCSSKRRSASPQRAEQLGEPWPHS
jgi:hypothetical protein